MSELNKHFKDNVSEKEIFLSPETRMFFQHLADMVTERYSEKLIVNIEWDDPKKTACTDNVSVTLNANCNIFNGLSCEERMLGCIGFLAHELGHVLYSDFSVRNKIIFSFKKGKTPDFIEKLFSQSMKECFEKDLNSSIRLLCEIENYMEDKFVEHFICQFYEGTFKVGIIQNDMIIKRYYLKRKEQKKESIPEVFFALQVRNYSFYKTDLLKQPFLLSTQIFVDKILSLTTYKERYLNAVSCASFLWDTLWEEHNRKEQNKNEEKDSKEDNSDCSNFKGDYKKFSRTAKPLVKDASNEVCGNFSDVEDVSELIETILNREVIQKCKDEVAVDKALANIDMSQIGKKELVIESLSPCNDNYDISNLKKISNNLQRRVLKSVLQREKGIKKTGLSVGRRLDCKAIARGSSKQFSKTEFPNKKPVLSVCVVVDASGSMTGKRIEIAKQALIVLEDFCDSLKVPLLAFAHNALGKTYIYKIRDFISKRVKTKNLAFSIKEGGGNKDGEAIEYGVLKLKLRKERHKLLIIISDGKPSSYNNLKEGVEDIKRVIMLAKKYNIVTIPIAIGDDIKDLTTIYGDKLVDARNLDELPVELTNFLVKYLK